MRVLLTGGLGYIGSHICAALADAGYDFLILDNLSNSDISVKERLEKLTGRGLCFYKADIGNRDALDMIFSREDIDAVIHLAGYKAVEESVKYPLLYYDNNLSGTVSLLKAMDDHGIRKMLFSSSATVYGQNNQVPYSEEDRCDPVNPYGETKYMTERMLYSLASAKIPWTVMILRYFNPAGAHESGLIGEDPQGIPNNLFPYIMRVARGELPYLNIFGKDYPTPDGTGIRDYIHICDLAEGHVAALQSMFRGTEPENPAVYNLGTGRGCSVLEAVSMFEKSNNVKIPYRIAPRRQGDIAECYASAEKAENILGWKSKRSISDMCKDMWRFGQISLEHQNDKQKRY